MKACFFLQRKFAYVGHKIAKILQEKYGLEEFCGYVQTRSSFDFLKNQTEINYTTLLLDENIHKKYHHEKLDLVYLQKIEKEYGFPNLWPYIVLDRIIMYNMLLREYPYNTPRYSHEEMMLIFQVQTKKIINFLEQEKPDFIFITVVGSIGSMLLYQIAKKKNIKIFITDLTRIGGDCILTDDYKKYTWVEKKFDNLMQTNKESKKILEARKYITTFRQKPITYVSNLNSNTRGNRRQQLKWFTPKYFIRSLLWFIKICYKYLVNKKINDHSIEQPCGYFIDRIKRKARVLRGFKKLYDKEGFNEDFAYFPLHYDPEIATLLFAPFWTDQINLIRQVAKSLPLHFKLYVKEHPVMLGYRPRSYYNELKKIPNVKLMNPKTDSLSIVRNSKLITTITGSAGFEGVVLKKPVITFGDVFYNKLSMVKKCQNIEKLPFIIKEQLENFNYNEKELENFIGVILEESADVGLQEIWEAKVQPKEEKRRLTLLVDLIAKKLNIQPKNYQ